MTPEILNVILNSPEILNVIPNSKDARTTTFHFECANLEGFTGALLSKFTNLTSLTIASSDLVTEDFISIVENLEPTAISTLILQKKQQNQQHRSRGFHVQHDPGRLKETGFLAVFFV